MEHTTPDEEARDIAARVDRLREKAGLSVRALAAESGIPATTLDRRLTGASPFNVAELAALAGVLGVTVPILAGASDNPNGCAA